MKSNDGTSSLADFLSHHAEVERPPLYAANARVGDWVVTGFLGRGGSAEVYCAKHFLTNRVAAVKILYRAEDAHRQRFAREAGFLSENPGAAFPALYGCGEHEGRLFMALELLEPLPLPGSDAAVARYVLNLTDGLAILHAKGFVHRDVKPRNVLARPGSSHPVLIDLGLIKAISAEPVVPGDLLSLVDGRSVGVGTPHYGAPEQFLGGAATPAMDIHALGMLVYECFDRQPPRVWADIIRRATSSIPRERFQSVGDFAAAVRRRHWRARARMAVLGLSLAVGGWFSWQALRSPLAPLCHNIVEGGRRITVVELNDRRNVFDRPIELSNDRVWRIQGPGVLDANLLAKTACVTVELSRCVVLNRSTVPMANGGIFYRFIHLGEKDGSYLNFTAQRDRTSGWWNCEEGRDGAFDILDFMGSDTMEGAWKRMFESEEFSVSSR